MCNNRVADPQSGYDCRMLYEVDGTTSDLGRCVSAELRARMAALRVSGKTLALKAGMSQNYFAKRLRDEAPFTLDDIESLVSVLLDDLVDPTTFITQAYERNQDEVWTATAQLERETREAKKSPSAAGSGAGRVDITHPGKAKISIAFDRDDEPSVQSVVEAAFPRAARRRTIPADIDPNLAAQDMAGEEDQSSV